MRRRPKSLSGGLFEVMPTPTQPRTTKPESQGVYQAVLRLRSAGVRVYRAGRDAHMVNGEWMGTRELLERARMGGGAI